MALPANGVMTATDITTGEYKTYLDNLIIDAARGNPEYDPSRTYEKGAKVKYTNDIVFTSMADGNSNNTPIADDGSNWYASVYDNVLGLWSDKTGSVSAGSGLYHNGILWRVESDIADVTLSKPSFTNANYSTDEKLKTLLIQTACDYTGGDLSLVDVIYVGLNIATVDYVIDRNTLTRWSVGSATGTVTADDLNVSTGALSGVTGTLINKDVVRIENSISDINNKLLLNYSERAVFCQRLASGNGGSSLSGSNKRILNTTPFNTITGASLSGVLGDFILPAGTYKIKAIAPCRAANSSLLRAYNSTAAQYITDIQSVGDWSSSSNDGGAMSSCEGVFTISTQSVLYIDHYIAVAVPNSGLGVGAGVGSYNQFTTVEIFKL